MQGGTITTISSRTENPLPQNGNGTLGVIFDSTACGLNYVTASQKLGQRFTPAGVIQPAPFTITGIPANASIIRAYLIANGSGNGTPQTATIVGPSITQVYPMSITGISADICWNYAATYTYRADITSVISGNGTYMVSGLDTSYDSNGSMTETDINGATILVVYNIPSATNDARLILADGSLTVLSGTGTYNMLYPAVCDTPLTCKAFSIVSDYQLTNCVTTMNGTSITITGNRWDFLEVNTTVNSGQSSSAYSVSRIGECFALCFAGLWIPSANCSGCPSPGNVLNFSTNTTPDVCSSCNGTASVTSVSGGLAPYTYQWSTNPQQNTATAVGLCAGIYTVVVTSGGGVYTSTQTVVVPAQGTGINTVSVTQTDVTCNGGNDGTASFTVAGGQNPITFGWSPTVTTSLSGYTSSASVMQAGTYTAIATESGGCSTSFTFTITQPPAFTSTTTSTSYPICNGDSTGTAAISISGGTPPYNYTWLPYGGNNATATGLAAQTYTVSVGDTNGCNYLHTVTITEPSAIGISIFGGNVLCNGGSDGYLNTNVNGGNPGYSWLWSTGDTIQNISNLTPGIYSVTVTDMSGCTATQSANVTEPLPFTIAFVITLPTACAAADGSIDITVTGQVQPYLFSWSNGSTSEDLILIASGIYTVTVTDISGCTATQQIVISDPASPAVTFSEPTDTACTSNGPFALSGFSPTGGTFISPAVTGSSFDPSLATVGYNVITYVYTDTSTQCTASATDSIYVDICTNASDESISAATIYPNPSDGHMIILITVSARYELYDIEGKIISAGNLQNNRNEIDLSNYANGIYMLRIYCKESVVNQKIVLHKN